MKKLLISTIQWYQKYLSTDTGLLRSTKRKTCVFYPTCSEYTIQALHKYGLIKGSLLGVKRIVTCHPWQKRHIDELQ